jgi:hypothetical protein
MRYAIVAFALVAGCQSGGGVVETFDAGSSLTVVTDPELVVFARTQGQLSRSARDYLYLGPVEVNERGLKQYYLWVGIGSTIDRALLGAEAAGTGLLILEAGGAPMELALAAWDERVPRLAGRPIYDPVVRPSRVLAARVTRDQLALIASAGVERLQLVADETTAREYILWEQSDWWPTFIGRPEID